MPDPEVHARVLQSRLVERRGLGRQAFDVVGGTWKTGPIGALENDDGKGKFRLRRAIGLAKLEQARLGFGGVRILCD